MSRQVPWTRHAMRRVAMATAGVIAGGLLAASPAWGQRVFFNPSLGVWGYYSDDVDAGAGAERTSDTSYRLQADLPLRLEFPRSTLDLGVTPFIERYERSDGLDHEGYRARALLAVEPSALSAIEIAVRAHRFQSLDAVATLDEPESFVTPGIERQLEAVETHYRRLVGDRWSWDLDLGYTQWSFAVPGDAEDELALLPEGRDELGGEIGFYSSLSSRTTLGSRYGRRRFELDRGGRETLDLLSLFLAHRLSPQWELEVLAGGYRREGTLSDGTDLASDGPQGTLTMIRAFRRAELAVRAGNVLSSGGELPGTAELRLLEVTLGDNESHPAGWRLLARVARRVATSAEVPTIDLATIGGGGEIELHRLVGLRLEAFYTEQSGDLLLDDSYYGIGAAIIVHPLGRTRLGGAGEGDSTADE